MAGKVLGGLSVANEIRVGKGVVVLSIFPWTHLSLGRLCGVVGETIKALGLNPDSTTY